MRRTAKRSDGEGRPAAAAAGRVRVLEREAGFLEVALVVDDDAVQVLRAELVHEQPDPRARDHHIVRGGLGFHAQAVFEARAAAREHGDAQPHGVGGRLLFRQELADFLARALREGQRDRRLLGGAHHYPPVWAQLRGARRRCQRPRLALAARGPPIGGPMTLTFGDWLIIGLYFAFNVGIGFYYKARAGKSTAEFFLSGRNVPWWLAGTSMVATTFAADTPLVVTGFVAKNGIAGNWIWWCFLASGMLTVFFYARLWRRAQVMTDVEFAEIRYAGKPAAFLRGFRALYLGIPINCIILGWVNLAMVKILQL